MDDQKDIYFHLLKAGGNEIEETIHADRRADEKRFELEGWYTVEGKACLVQRIAFDKNRVDIYLQQVDKTKLQ